MPVRPEQHHRPALQGIALAQCSIRRRWLDGEDANGCEPSRTIAEQDRLPS